MQFRDILVHLKAHEEWSGHIDYAIGLAAHFQAGLHALVTFAEIGMLRAIARRKDDPAVKEQERRDAATVKALAARLQEKAAPKGVDAVLHRAEGPASELVTWAARFHDLTIIEQRDDKRDEHGYDPAEEAVLAAGRPVLVVPRRGRFQPRVRRILLAWNASQQSAAALQNALPFIGQADSVVICIGEDRKRLRGNLRYPPFDIQSCLARHVREVALERVDVPPDQVGEHLLGRANELGADMLVMGAYGRSWYSEMLLGGATRHILRHLTLPVLTGR
jgi:nucleotide-binding universal stress UspA family protein